MKRIVMFLVLFVVMTCTVVFAQDKVLQKAPKSEVLPSATFTAGFEKLFENPLFSWRADIDMDFVGYRKGRHNLTGRVRFLTVGARPSRGSINIAGLAYGLDACYKYYRTETNWFSVCNNHLSLHRTEELLVLEKEEIEKGRITPSIYTMDVNVISFGAGFMLKAPAEPKFVFLFQPIRFHYGGGFEFYGQPLYFTSRFALVKGRYVKLSFATEHEFGISPFNVGYLSVDLFLHEQEDGRAQIYIGYSPNQQLQPSVNEGVRRGGFKTGVRLIWDAH